jgi:hypothetical protein
MPPPASSSAAAAAAAAASRRVAAPRCAHALLPHHAVAARRLRRAAPPPPHASARCGGITVAAAGSAPPPPPLPPPLGEPRLDLLRALAGASAARAAESRDGAADALAGAARFVAQALSPPPPGFPPGPLGDSGLALAQARHRRCTAHCRAALRRYRLHLRRQACTRRALSFVRTLTNVRASPVVGGCHAPTLGCAGPAGVHRGRSAALRRRGAKSQRPTCRRTSCVCA